MMDLYCMPVANNTASSSSGDDHPPTYIVTTKTNTAPVRSKSRRNVNQKKKQKTRKQSKKRPQRKSSLLVDYSSSKAKAVEEIAKERKDLFPETDDVILQLKINSMDGDDDDHSDVSDLANEDSFALDENDDNEDEDDDEVSVLGMEEDGDNNNDDDDVSSIGVISQSPDEIMNQLLAGGEGDEVATQGGAASLGSISFCIRRRSSNKSGVHSLGSEVKTLSSYDHLQNSLGAMIMAEQEDEHMNNSSSQQQQEQQQDDQQQQQPIVSPSMNRRLQLARSKSRNKSLIGDNSVANGGGMPAAGRPSPAPTRLLRRARSMRLSDLQLSNHGDDNNHENNKIPNNNGKQIRRPIGRSKSMNTDQNNNDQPLTSSSHHGLQRSFRVMDLLSRSTHGGDPFDACKEHNNDTTPATNGGGKSRCKTCRQFMEKARKSLNDSKNNSMALCQALEETFALHTIKSGAAAATGTADGGDELDQPTPAAPPTPRTPLSNLPRRTKSTSSARSAMTAASGATADTLTPKNQHNNRCKNNRNRTSLVSALLANKPTQEEREDRRSALLKTLKNNSEFSESLRSITDGSMCEGSKMSHAGGGSSQSTRRSSCMTKGTNIRRISTNSKDSNHSNGGRITTASALQKSLLMMSTAIFAGDLDGEDEDDGVLIPTSPPPSSSRSRARG